MKPSANASLCRDDRDFTLKSTVEPRTDWLGNPLPVANRSSVATEVDWLGRPTRSNNAESDEYLRQRILSPVSVPTVNRIVQKRSTPPPAPPSLTFGQKSCLAYATGAAFTGTVASAYTAKSVAAPVCAWVPPPYNVGCIGGIVGGGATIGGLVGGMTATQSPVCKDKFPWTR